MAGNLEIKNAQGKNITLQNPDTNGSDIVVDLSDVASKTEVALKANTADLKEIGVGQTWQNVIASRSTGVTYTNSTGKPIVVSIRAGSVQNNLIINIDGLENVLITSTSTTFVNGYIIVPNGSTYSATHASISKWSELR